MDETNEQSESAGGRSNPERTDLQLTEPERPVYSRGEQLSLFPTESEQIKYISEAEGQSSAFSASVFTQSVPQDTVDHILRMGGNSDNTRMQLVTEYSKGKSLEEITDLLQKLYHGGNGIVTDSGRYSAWYAEDGIHISSGDSTQYMASAQIVSWEDAAKRIGELLDSGQFAANVETTEARTLELKTAAEHLWYLHHDFADNVRDEYFDAIIRWQRDRNGVTELLPEHIGYENGVLGGVVSALGAFCSKGDAVLVHSPTYLGFTMSLKNNGYNAVASPLVRDENGVWRMDLADM